MIAAGANVPDEVRALARGICASAGLARIAKLSRTPRIMAQSSHLAGQKGNEGDRRLSCLQRMYRQGKGEE
jgi:hypothetical protein